MYFVDAADDSEAVVPYTAMVGCWGYSTPYNTDEFRARVMELSELETETERLETVMGPLKRAVYLSF